MIIESYEPITVAEVVSTLEISDDDELSGEHIAFDLLAGNVLFSPNELRRLAIYRGIEVDELTEIDPSFRRYADAGAKARREIAVALIRRDFAEEFTSEVCGLPIETVVRLGAMSRGDSC